MVRKWILNSNLVIIHEKSHSCKCLINQVSPGHQIEASVTGQTIISDDKLNRIRMEKRMCATGNEITLKFFDTYTGPYCYLDCVAEAYINDCGCVPFHLPGTFIINFLHIIGGIYVTSRNSN